MAEALSAFLLPQLLWFVEAYGDLLGAELHAIHDMHGSKSYSIGQMSGKTNCDATDLDRENEPESATITVLITDDGRLGHFWRKSIPVHINLNRCPPT
jgi:hypothetical protein